MIAPLPRTLASLVLLSLVAGLLAAAPPATAQEPAPITSKALQTLSIRSIGPAVTGGRIHDVEAVPDDPETLYIGTASGGLWKSTNGGTTWASLFDEQPVSTFGDVAIAPSNSDIVWAGTGEQQNRQSTSWGNGVYRSVDGGASWTHLGLVETRHIGRIQVHPEDPDVAYVAAQGTLWAPSDSRGVYKTTDGGETWTKVLFIDAHTGVVDMVMHPENPDVLYAAAYQRLRRTWGFNGGGPGSGIYKTTDGGATWTELTNGIPAGDKGRIGIDVSPVDPQTVYALVEHADSSGTYRSRDGGASWTHVNDLNPRPMYYSHIAADPVDRDRVYVLSTEAYTSSDGGDTFTRLPTRPTYDIGVHSDHHSMWIDPSDPHTFYLAGDAGLHITHDRGQTYRRINNIPIGQFYAIGVDSRRPYQVYGGMQDNHSWMGPSDVTRWIGIINDDWKQIGFGDGMYQQVSSPRAVFVGSQNGGLARFDPVTGDRMNVEPSEPADADYRFDWVTPTHVSRFDSSVVYLGGNRLFLSRDRGQTWTRTEDLTKDIDRATLSLMGVPGDAPMLSKHDGTASYGEITTIAESPLDARILWVGTDDGNVQVSRDGGANWTEVGANIERVPDAPGDTTYVSRVVASAASPGTAYVTLDAHRDGDFAPYVYKTTDFGQTWSARTRGLTVENAGSVNVLLEHPDDPQVLFLGTEHALFVSTTAGEEWAEVAQLPPTLYDDLAVQRQTNDLVIGTHGRSLWIWDDTTPLVEWDEAQGTAAHLFSIQPATLAYPWKNTSYRGQEAYSGTDDPRGALLHYHLASAVDSVQITIRNSDGEVIRTLTGAGRANTIHQVEWDLEHPAPPVSDFQNQDDDVLDPDTVLPAPRHPLDPQGPLVAPGRYTVTLEAGDATSTQTVRVHGHPDLSLTDEQWHDREAFLVDLLDLQRRAFPEAERAEQVADSLTRRRDSLAANNAVPDDLAARADSAAVHADALDDVRDDLYGLASVFNMSGVTQPTLHPPRDAHLDRKQHLADELERRIRAWRAFARTLEN
jgi:photosystem II stability/assembly factor-like uncharacterized protein